MSFSVSRDYFYGGLRVLNEHRDEALDLMRFALTAAPTPTRRRGRG